MKAYICSYDKKCKNVVNKDILWYNNKYQALNARSDCFYVRRY